jgi:hypothetical protein
MLLFVLLATAFANHEEDVSRLDYSASPQYLSTCLLLPS